MHNKGKVGVGDESKEVIDKKKTAGGKKMKEEKT